MLDEAAMVSADHWSRNWESLWRLGEQRLRDDPELVQRVWPTIQPNHPAAILYTFGEQKGVVLTHQSTCFAAAALHQAKKPERHAPRLCHLPLANIAERTIGLYAAIHDVAHMHLRRSSPNSRGAGPRPVDPLLRRAQGLGKARRRNPDGQQRPVQPHRFARGAVVAVSPSSGGRARGCGSQDDGASVAADTAATDAVTTDAGATWPTATAVTTDSAVATRTTRAAALAAARATAVAAGTTIDHERVPAAAERKRRQDRARRQVLNTLVVELREAQRSNLAEQLVPPSFLRAGSCARRSMPKTRSCHQIPIPTPQIRWHQQGE
ncbi:AMP-binding protein [Saccharopolyspora sp. NPDC000995]